jgi:hypothetical protein
VIRVTARIALGAAAGTLLFAGPALASPATKAPAPQTGVQTSGAPAGYAVDSNTFNVLNDGGTFGGGAVCPGTEVPVGGGVFVTSGSLLADVHYSFPEYSKAQHIADWSVGVDDDSGADTTATAYVVCINRPANYRFVRNALNLPPGAQTTGRATCPTGTSLLGGGVNANIDGSLVDINSIEPQSKTTWRVDMNNPTSTNGIFQVIAICGSKPQGYTIVSGALTDNAPGAQDRAFVACPGAEVPLSGGVFSDSSSTAVDVNSTVPSVVAGSSEWVAFENNASGTDADITARAVCAGT